MIELTDEIILKIDNLLDAWSLPAIEIGIAVHKGKEIPNKYANNDIFIEYYNGIKDGKSLSQMRVICLPKYIRRELSKNN